MNTRAPAFPWHVFYDQDVPHTLDYPEVPLHELVRRSFERHPEQTALIFFGKHLSYKDVGKGVQRLAEALVDLGINAGDRIALLLPNCPQYVIAYYAILQAGAVVVPINPLSTEAELMYIFRDAGVRMAIALDLLVDRVENVRESLRNSGEDRLLEHVFYTGLNKYMPFPLKVIYPFTRKLSSESKKRLRRAARFQGLLSGAGRIAAISTQPPAAEDSPVAALASADPCRDEQRSTPDIRRDPAVLLYTGGTTGKPKGVMLSHYALVCNAWQAVTWVNMNTQDRLLTVLPIFHGFGMSVGMNAPLIAGSSCVLIPRFSSDEILKAIDCYRPTLFAGVPTMYIALINHPDLPKYQLSSLRGCFVGAAPLAPEIKRRFEQLTGSKLMEGYGLTEAVTAICANPLHGVNKTGSIGIPFPDVEIEIRDLETGTKRLPPNETGELVVRCPELMLGYYNRPEETRKALRDGWLYTGDIGYMDDDGYFFIVDRKKDMIITGGFNVYPREVEDILYEHPAVKEACVIGLPHDYKGEMVVAYVTLKEGMKATEQELIAFCRQFLVPYKVPSKVEFRSELPKTAIGKVLRRALREMALREMALNETAAGSPKQ